MKTLLVVPDGTGLRNFFFTRFIDLLLAKGEVIVWHALPEQSLKRLRGQWKAGVRWGKIPPIRDGLFEQIARKARVYAQLFWQRKQGPVVQLKRLHRPRRWTTRMVDRVARVLGWIHAGPDRIVRLDELYRALASRAPHLPAFERALKDFSPDVVFCLHQRGLQAVPAMLAAQRLGIPNATFIYSWDNLPKGRTSVPADHYFVWSDLMKRELLEFYPEVPAEQVHVVGTPQFEEYHNPALVQKREHFLSELGLDPSRPVVCFSGDDVLTSPHDPLYLADLASALRAVPLPARPQILFRRSPVDRSHRYDRVLADFPEIAVSDPLWALETNGDWSQIIPLQEDSTLLVNIAYHSDLVVNVGSTMAMDFAVYDKPAIFLAYDPAGGEGGWNVEETYQLPHFASVHRIQPVYWARSRDGLGALVLRVLASPEEKGEARKQWLHLLVHQPMDRASERIVLALGLLATPNVQAPAVISARNNLQPSSI